MKTFKKIYNLYQNLALYIYVMHFIKMEALRDKAEKFIHKQNDKIKDGY